ncbi:MAG: ACP S-malonyltransferase [Armatimonadetes bacterium]|nr:ACP S-malonyltransferase [Armatimonadota bacterium]
MGVLTEKKVALVFPGQGSQAVGMGKDFAESFPDAAEIFDRADRLMGYSISQLCFSGPEDELRQTVNTQPALYVTSAAALTALYSSQSHICKEGSRKFFPSYEGEVENKGLMSPLLVEQEPEEVSQSLLSTKEGLGEILFTAGHSVGEYAALYAAGAFSFETGLALVRRRAELMQEAAEASPGTMAAILGLSSEQVMEVVEKASNAGVVVAANFNSPIQTVISGDQAGVVRACEVAAEMGAKRVVPLNVSGAFHSPLMQSAASRLAEILGAAEIGDPVVPVVANYTADIQTSAAQIRENLAKQITGSVRWVESVQRMLDAGVNAFIELGSGNVLGGLIKRIAPEAEVYSVMDRASLEELLA